MKRDERIIHLRIPDPDWDPSQEMRYVLVYFVRRRIFTFSSRDYLLRHLMKGYGEDETLSVDLQQLLYKLYHEVTPRDRLSFIIGDSAFHELSDPPYDINKFSYSIDGIELATILCCTDITEELQRIERQVDFTQYNINPNGTTAENLRI